MQLRSAAVSSGSSHSSMVIAAASIAAAACDALAFTWRRSRDQAPGLLSLSSQSGESLSQILSGDISTTYSTSNRNS